MTKIVLIPLDERPCNYLFPQDLAAMTDVHLIVPPRELLGNKKQPGNMDGLWSFLNEKSTNAVGVVISIDTLLYGGIVPSRLHQDSVETLLQRLSQLETFRANNPNILIYAFNLIMRNPVYSSSDEEPDYYETYGREIHLRGVFEHKASLGMLTSEEQTKYDQIVSMLDNDAWDDYTARRQRNIEVNKQVIRYVQSGVIDQLIVPQDDASPYGLTALNQQQIRATIKSHRVMSRVFMYPGADEVANTLISKMVHTIKGNTPKVFLKYASEQAPFVIPLYEDRPLGETVKYQVLAAGGIIVHSEEIADVILIVNAPSGKLLNASEAYKKGIEYDAFRSLNEAVLYGKFWLNQGKPVAIADVAYGNGSDLELIQLLQEQELLFAVAGYAGWNTSSNTLGTVIPQALFYLLYGPSQAHYDFLGLRYVEDAGYCALVRQDTIRDDLPVLGLNYFKADGERGQVASIVKSRLVQSINNSLIDPNFAIQITDCWMPWRRMFEVGLRVKVVQR